MGNASPFGQTITAQSILEDLLFFDSWEDRYRYIIDLGKQLPAMPDELKTDVNLVRGCQSQVWVHADYDEQQGLIQFLVDSDAHIVRGLAAMVMAAFNGQTPQAILAFDIDHYFDQSQLIQHLSPTRGNGLQSMVKQIRSLASQARR